MDAKEPPWPVICAIAISCIAGCEQPSSSLPDQNRTAPVAIVDPPELELDYNAFDQTLGQGWRKLADEGTHLGAAKLLDTYFEHKDGLEDWQRINLRFHAGQLYAFAGENATALSRFKASINPSEPEDSHIRWNAYVRATIAFLEKDREQIVKMRDEIAEGPKFQGIVPNLDVVDRLVHNFDQPYSNAYTVQQRKSPE